MSTGDGNPFVALLLKEPLDAGLEDTIVEIPLDVRESSTYTYESEISDFPVEEGASITDNVRLKPVKIRLDGFVSDAPLVVVPTSSTSGQLRGDSQSAKGSTYTQAAFDALKAVREKSMPLTYVGEFETVEDMMIESLEIPRTREVGLGFRFSLTLKKITVVSTLTSALPSDVVARLKRRRTKNTSSDKLKKLRAQNTKQVETGKLSADEASTSEKSLAQTSGANYGR